MIFILTECIHSIYINCLYISLINNLVSFISCIHRHLKDMQIVISALVVALMGFNRQIMNKNFSYNREWAFLILFIDFITFKMRPRKVKISLENNLICMSIQSNMSIDSQLKCSTNLLISLFLLYLVLGLESILFLIGCKNMIYENM